MRYEPDALKQLQHYESEAVLRSALALLSEGARVTEASAPALINDLVTKTGVKRSVVMRTLRAALTGRMDGTELGIVWSGIQQKGIGKHLLIEALALTERIDNE